MAMKDEEKIVIAAGLLTGAIAGFFTTLAATGGL